MRILHTADWHLGKLFHGLHLTGDQARFFETEFLPLVRDLRPDLVVVAGDIFDRPVPPAEAVGLLGEILTGLHELGVTVALIPGNHDSRERLAFARELLARLRIHVAVEEEFLLTPLRWGQVSLYLAPHLTPLHLKEILERQGWLPETFSGEGARLWELLLRNLPPLKGPRLFVGHLLVEGGRKGDSELELWVGGEEGLPGRIFRDFQLVLLGHLHQAQRPEENIYYAGSPFPLSFSEAEITKGVWLFELAPETGRASSEFIPLSPPWELKVIRGTFQEILREPPTSAYVKIILEDETPVPQAFERLRKLFPRLLVLETPNLWAPSGERLLPSTLRQWDTRELFEMFLREVGGRPPTDEERALLTEALRRLPEPLR